MRRTPRTAEPADRHHLSWHLWAMALGWSVKVRFVPLRHAAQLPVLACHGIFKSLCELSHQYSVESLIHLLVSWNQREQKTYWPDLIWFLFTKILNDCFQFTTRNTQHVSLYITAHGAKTYADKILPKRHLFALPPNICPVCLLAVTPSAAV